MLFKPASDEDPLGRVQLGWREARQSFCPQFGSQTAVTLTEVDRMTWEHNHTHSHTHFQREGGGGVSDPQLLLKLAVKV